MNLSSLSWPRVFTYAVIVASVLFALFSLGDGASEQSATMAPDLRVLR
jgi:hypothetical protein